jgi:peptide deformylase
MILKVLTYPDARLREVSKPVTVFDATLKKFAKDLLETMYAENGIGLAAAQVGELKRMLVIDTRPRDTKGRYEKNEMTELESKIDQALVIINPEIIKGNGKTTFNEGCLSVPSFFEEVERFETIELKYQDVDGNTKILVTDGLLAICIQHEMDHLEGTLFIDHLSLVKSNKIKNSIKKNGYPEKEKDKSKDKETVKL